MDTKLSSGVAFLIGATAGGVAALLFAPRSGEQTRRRIRRTTKNLVEEGEEAAVEVKDAAKERAGDIADSARAQISAVKDAVAEAKHTYREEMKHQRRHHRSTEPEHVASSNEK